jgi:mRNA interferase MazF
MNTYTQFSLWLTDLNPRFGTEMGKISPVVVIQTDLLNEIGHPSTLVCPLTTKTIDGAFPLRIAVAVKNTELQKASDILVDQMSAIDNRRFSTYLGKLDEMTIVLLKTALKQVLGL